MENNKTSKIIANIIYSFGVLCFLILAGMFLFGGDIVPNPNAMIPSSLSLSGVLGMAIGFIPLLIVTFSVRRLNEVKKSTQAKLWTALLFLPAGLCGLCFLFFVGLFFYFLGNGWLIHLRKSFS